MHMINQPARFLGLIFLSLGTLMPAAIAESNETESARAILVLDASGSMWGQVDGTPKIAIAREVIQGLLQDWDPKVELGVSTYGHREKGNCGDIETLVSVGQVDGAQIMTAIEGLNPKGKTPLTDAVRQAAEQLRYTEERATVILVSDGKETCDADPCAVAQELEANGIDFTTHVVGFDLTEEEKAQLQCIADQTGGRFLSADSASELHTAMATTVQLVAEPEPQQTGPTGFRVTATLTDGGEPVRAKIDVYEAKQDPDGKRQYIEQMWTTPDKLALFKLPPGPYFFEASHGLAVVAGEVVVKAGELTEQTITIPAGSLRLAGTLTDGGEPVKAMMNIYEAKKDLEGKREYITQHSSDPDNPASFRLPAGDYFVEASYGDAVATSEAVVKAGELTEQTITIAAGHLRLIGTLSDGGEPVKAMMNLYEAKKDLEGRRQYLKQHSSEPDKPALFRLPVGKYFVEAEYGNATGGNEVEVRAGELTEAVVIIEAGHLRLATILDEDGEPLDENVRYEVFNAKKDLNGNRKSVATAANGSKALFKLPADRYFIAAAYRPDQGNAVATAEVEVRPDELTEQTLSLNAGYLKLTTTAGEDGEKLDSDLVYEVFNPKRNLDGDRKMIVSRSDAIPRLSLIEGTYFVRVKYNSSDVAEAEIMVPAGEMTEHIFVLGSGD